MSILGRHNRLTVTRIAEIGAFVDGGELGEILLPRRYVGRATAAGDQLELFVYRDSQDRLVATTDQPLARVGECAWLRVVSQDRHGAFLDWGLPKDLFLPYAEQAKPLKTGRSCAAYLFVDERSHRIVASTRLEKYLSLDGTGLSPRSPVNCLVHGRSDLGYKAIVDNRYLGQFYDNETFRQLRLGQRLDAWIRRIRPDGRIDLCLQLDTRAEREGLEQAIVAHLQANRGESELTDRSPPEAIYREFSVSKASYKKALGRLYKRRDIDIADDRIRLLQGTAE